MEFYPCKKCGVLTVAIDQVCACCGMNMALSALTGIPVNELKKKDPVLTEAENIINFN